MYVLFSYFGSHLKIIILFVFIALMSSSLSAAEISRASGMCSHKLEGKISLGDLEKVQSVFDPHMANDRNERLCLNSPEGGSLREGIKLANYFFDAGIPTGIESGDKCVSACAVAFMGGSRQLDDYVRPDRTIQPSAHLGFHAPSIPFDQQTTARTFNVVYKHAIEDIGKLTANAPRWAFGSSLIAEMLQHFGEDVYYIDEIQKALSNGIDIDTKFRKKSNITKINALYACNNYYRTNFSDRLKKSRLPTIDSVKKFQSASGELYYDISHYPPEFSQKCRLLRNPSQSSWSISVFGEGNEKKELYYLTIPDYYFLNGSTKISYLENSNNSLKNVIKSKNNYKDFYHQDLNGILVKKLKSKSLINCRYSCNSVYDCEGFTYDKWNKWCFLKKGISKARLEPKAISAIKDGFDTRVSSSTARLKWINLKGKEFSQLSGWEEYFEPSYRACFDRCVDFHLCLAISYYPDKKKCRIVTNPLEYFSKAGVYSGIKRQVKY